MYNFRTAGCLTCPKIWKCSDQCLTVSPGAQHLGAMLNSPSLLASCAGNRGHRCEASSSAGQRIANADSSFDYGEYCVYSDSNESLQFIVIMTNRVQGTQMQLPHCVSPGDWIEHIIPCSYTAMRTARLITGFIALGGKLLAKMLSVCMLLFRNRY